MTQETATLDTSTLETENSIHEDSDESNGDSSYLCFERHPDCTCTPCRPSFATDASGGLDLYAAVPASLDPVDPPHWIFRSGDSFTVGTGLCVDIPDGYYGLIVGRSSLTVKGIRVVTGVIDRGYKGELKVVMENINNPFMKHPIPNVDRDEGLLIRPDCGRGGGIFDHRIDRVCEAAMLRPDAYYTWKDKDRSDIEMDYSVPIAQLVLIAQFLDIGVKMGFSFLMQEKWHTYGPRKPVFRQHESSTWKRSRGAYTDKGKPCCMKKNNEARFHGGNPNSIIKHEMLFPGHDTNLHVWGMHFKERKEEDKKSCGCGSNIGREMGKFFMGEDPKAKLFSNQMWTNEGPEGSWREKRRASDDSTISIASDDGTVYNVKAAKGAKLDSDDVFQNFKRAHALGKSTDKGDMQLRSGLRK